MKHRSAGVSPASFGTVPVPVRAVCTMNKRSESSLTQKAMQALTETAAKVVEDHHRGGIPLAVWRNGRAVSIPATEAGALSKTPTKSLNEYEPQSPGKPSAFSVQPLAFYRHGNLNEITGIFGGANQLGIAK